MKSQELRQWHQAGISLYDIEILLEHDLDDDTLREFFTAIRDNGVNVNDVDYVLRHSEIGAEYQKNLLDSLADGKDVFQSNLFWMEEKGLLDTSKDTPEDTPESESEIERLCAIVDEILESYDNNQVDFEKQYTSTGLILRALFYNQGGEMMRNIPLFEDRSSEHTDGKNNTWELTYSISTGAVPFTRLIPFDLAVLDVFYTLYCMDISVIPLAMVDKLLAGNKSRVQSEKKVRVIQESVQRLQAISISLKIRGKEYAPTPLLDVEVFDSLISDGKKIPTVYYLNGICSLYQYVRDYQEVADVPREYYDTTALPPELAFEDTQTAILLKRRVITKVMGIIRDSTRKGHKNSHWNRLSLEQKRDKTKGIFPDLDLMPDTEGLDKEGAEAAYQKWRKKEKPLLMRIVKGTLENLKANYAILDYEDFRENPKTPVIGFDIICFTQAEKKALAKMRDELKASYVQKLREKRQGAGS